jgi:hypothetical protein
MKRLLFCFSCLLISISAGLVQAEVQPVLVFQDTFDVSQNDYDLNFEYTGGRQSGTVAPITYSDPAEFEGLAQLENSGAPGWLWLQPDDIENTAYVSPNFNFNNVGPFTIEFDINPGFDDPDNTGTDWAAIVLGASSQNAFVNASNGIGILFRNNGNIQVFNGPNAVYGGTGGIAGGLPLGEFHVAIEVDVADYFGQSPATMRLFIDGEQAIVSGIDSMELVKTAGLTSNFVTLMGYAGGGNTWVHLFDNLKITGIPCLEIGESTVETMRGETSDPVSVTIPAGLNDTEAAQVVITSSAPGVAAPTGADENGSLTLEFPAGGATTQTFTIEGLSPGTATLQFASLQGICVSQNLTVMVASGVPVPELVFLDTYNTSDENWDINFEINTNRQSGSAAPLSYTEIADTAAGGINDLFTIVNSVTAPDELYVVESWVAPDHNFLEGNTFTIEFDVHPGYNNDWYDDPDWAGIIFGTSAPGVTLPPAQGIGVLFRNSLRYQVFSGPTAVYESPIDPPLPTPPFHVEFDVQTTDFSGGGPAIVSMYINGTQYPLTASTPELTKADGLLGNYITLQTYGFFLEHSFDNLQVSADACIRANTNMIEFEPGETSYQLTVQVPAGSNATEAVDVTLTSANPNIATMNGAVDGVLELTFAAGASNSQAVTVQATGKGQTTIGMDTTSGICFNPPITVSVRTALVVNPSFEIDPEPPAPGYGAITAWTGGSGLNSGGPFSDNGIVPDRSKVAFLQGGSSMSQDINGMEPGQLYWLQFFYNTRNCCGVRSVDMSVAMDGEELVYIPNIQPVGANLYEFQNVEFSAGDGPGLLSFANTVTGDATSLLDAVTIVKRSTDELIIRNPSFEASGTPPWPGYIQPARLAGWTGTGSYGVNLSGAGPFADNGINPDQDLVAFIQGEGSLSQTIYGFVPGEEYTLTFSANARLGNTPNLVVTANGVSLLDETLAAVEDAAYTSYSIPFTPEDAQVILTFTQVTPGDQTVLLDDVRVLGERSQLPCISVTPNVFNVTVGQTGNLVNVTVPQELSDLVDPVYVTVSTSDMDVLVPDGANDQGQLTLAFPASGPLTKSFDVLPLQRGTAQLFFSNPHGACFDNPVVTFNATRDLVKNPSFQDSGVPAWPGYGQIAAWGQTGNAGVNNNIAAASPFADNGVIPDQNQVGFIQQNGNAIFQNIGGLVAGEQYWLQFAYNTRTSTAQLDLAVSFAGASIIEIPEIPQVGESNPYHQASVAFTPTVDSGQLRFENTTTGDATVLLDAISITKRDADQVMIINPSFEASGTPPWPGVIGPALMAGWTGTGNYGVNLSGPGPYADNGLNPDQERVLLLQELASVSQTVSGLTVGETYNLSYAYNARSGNSPILQVSLNGSVVHETAVTAVGGENPYHVHHYTFTANQDTATITFSQAAVGDNTVLIDDVKLAVGAGPVELILDIQPGDTAGTVDLMWPASGPQSKLQTAPATGGPWTDVTEPAVEEGGVMVVTIQAGETPAFFKLVQE